MSEGLSPERQAHSCDLNLDGHLFKETRCIIAPDGSKYLVFTGKIGAKDVNIRLRDDEWTVNQATGNLQLKADPETVREYVRLLASA